METTPPALEGQTALVTGGARRVGAEIVRHLHAAGASVAIHCHRSIPEAQALAAELEARRHGSAAVYSADLRQPDAAQRLISAVVARFGGLQLLVNNAASFYPTPWPTVTEAQWADLMGTNLQAPLFLAQAASAELRRARGLIVNIVDIHGMRALPGYIVYSTSKAALSALTRELAVEFGQLGVRVNAVAPGEIRTAMLSPETETLIPRIPLHRLGTPEDVADTVHYLCGPGAAYVTGTEIFVTGGEHLYAP